MPYEGWIDARGFFDSVGYAINMVLIGLTIALAWLTVRDLKRERDHSEGKASQTGTLR